MAQQNIQKKLYDLLTTKNFDNFEIFDSQTSKPPIDPVTGQEDLDHADMFKFDWSGTSGKNYGTAVILLNTDGELEIYFGDNLGRSMEGRDKNEWYDFLHQLKDFATKNFKDFSPKNLNQLKYSVRGQAAIREGLFESWSGRKDVSWNAGANESRLMIKHKRALDEGEARFRYVESLFIETAEGERYKLPFRNLTAGKAMLEHVRAGGRPYDLRGQHIAEMVNELTVLSRFRRANAGRLLEGDTATLVEQATTYFENLRHNLKSLTTRRGYDSYFESWAPAQVTEEEVVIEGLKHLFVTQSIDQRIEDALPLIARIQQQENAMKEATIFEAWANQLMEGTWATPDTPEKQAQLIELLSTDLPVGADATNATEQLYDLLGDDQLFDQLQELADRDANADARQVVLMRMQELASDPDVRKVIDELNIDATAEMNPPEQTPADLDTDQDMKEAVKDPYTQTEDPPGTPQPAYPEYQDDLASILKHAGVPAKERAAPDYEPELDETTTAEIIKQILSPFGTAAGAAVGGSGGKSLLQQPVGETETDEGVLGTVGGAMGGGLAGTLAGGAIGGALGGPAGAALGSEAGRTIGSAAGAVGGQELTKGGSSIVEKDEEIDEGILGQLAGGAFGTMAGGAAGSVLGGEIGRFAGGALGGTAGAMIGDKLGHKLDDQYKEEQLNEVGPAIAVGARLLMPMLSRIGPALGRAAASAGKAGADATGKAAAGVGRGTVELGKSAAQSAAKNAVPIGIGAGAYQAITDVATGLVGGVGEVYNDAGTAASALAKMVGNSLDQVTIESLASAAVKYAIPIGILIAVLYGGKKLIDKVFSESTIDEGSCNMTEAGTSCPTHGMMECAMEESPMQGQYGHSGRMKPVAEDSSFLHRLKELSGMIRN
jgi:hypothetical protein